MSTGKNKKGKGKGKGKDLYEDPNEKGMTEEEKKKYRQGRRRKDSNDSLFSYKSFVSAGGTRHVRRRRKRGDGTYSDSESYHSDQDVEGQKRRQKRRQNRKQEAIRKKAEKIKAGGRNDGSDSDYSYRSVISAGGTRHVKRRKKLADGTYGDEESYHSSQDEEGKTRRKERRKKREQALKEGKRNKDSDSEYSYRSVVSAGGTRHVKRRKKLADGTYGDEESYHSSQDEDGKARRKARRKERAKKIKAGKRNPDSDSEYSYKSYRSAGGTRHVTRRKKLGDGKYGDAESYHSSQDAEGEERRRRRRRERKHAGSAHSYFSVVSEGGTRHVRRRRKRKDGTYSDSESYHSSGSEFWNDPKNEEKKNKKKHGPGSAHSYYSEVSEGGTRRRFRKKKILDKDGKVIGYEDPKRYGI